jgi:hypothetical protein
MNIMFDYAEFIIYETQGLKCSESNSTFVFAEITDTNVSSDGTAVAGAG